MDTQQGAHRLRDDFGLDDNDRLCNSSSHSQSLDSVALAEGPSSPRTGSTQVQQWPGTHTTPHTTTSTDAKLVASLTISSFKGKERALDQTTSQYTYFIAQGSSCPNSTWLEHSVDAQINDGRVNSAQSLAEWRDISFFPYAHLSPAFAHFEHVAACCGGNKIRWLRCKPPNAIETLFTIEDKSQTTPKSDTENGYEEYLCLDWSVDLDEQVPILAAAGETRVIKVYDPTNGQVKGCLFGHGDSILDLKFSKINPHVLASASADHSIRLWNVKLTTATNLITKPALLTTPVTCNVPQGKMRQASRVGGPVITSDQASFVYSDGDLQHKVQLESQSNRRHIVQRPPKQIRKRTTCHGSSSESESETSNRIKANGSNGFKLKHKTTKSRHHGWRGPPRQLIAILAGFGGHKAAVTTLDWHPVLPLLASGGTDHTVKIWYLPTSILHDPTLSHLNVERTTRKWAPVLHVPLFSSPHLHDHWVDQIQWSLHDSSKLVSTSKVISAFGPHPFAPLLKRDPIRPKPRSVSGQDQVGDLNVVVWKPLILDQVITKSSLNIDLLHRIGQPLFNNAHHQFDPIHATIDEFGMAFVKIFCITLKRPVWNEDVSRCKTIFIFPPPCNSKSSVESLQHVVEVGIGMVSATSQQECAQDNNVKVDDFDDGHTQSSLVRFRAVAISPSYDVIISVGSHESSVMWERV